MKFARLAVTTAAALAVLSTATGCAFFKTNKPVANGAGANPAVTAVKPLAVTTPPPQPVVIAPVQPVISEAPPVVTPANAVTASSTSSATASTAYTVRKGDTISKIARSKYGDLTAVRKIKEANPGIDYNNIKAGQKLMLP